MPSSVRKSEPASGVTSSRVTFDRFEVDLRSGELRKDGRKVRLPAQPFQLLTLLIENAGEVVTRDEVCRALWQTDTFVDFDHSVAAAVNKIREALGDSAENPRFVETLPGRVTDSSGRSNGTCRKWPRCRLLPKYREPAHGRRSCQQAG